MLSKRPNLGRRRARLALTGAAVGAALALAPSGGAVGRYADPTGDSKGAPDVTGVTVTSDAAGNLLFQIGIVDLPSPADVETLLILNTDANVATGAPDTGGADYIFVVDEADNSYGFARWNGADWDWETPYATVAIQTDRTSVSIAVNRSELGNTESLNFRVRTIAGEFETGQHDDAPESGSWNYTLATGGPDITGVIVST